MLTSGRNLQLFVPSPESQNLLQDYERHGRSRRSGVHMLVDSATSWEFSRTSSGAAADATSTTLLSEKSRAQLLNIIPDVDGVRVTSEKSQVGVHRVIATKLEIPRFSSTLIKAEQTDLNRPYLEAVHVQRSAADLFEIAALPSQLTDAQTDEMHVDYPLTPASAEQRMPPLELLTPTPNPFTPLRRTWSADRGEVTLPSTRVQETSPSSVVQIASFDHNHQTSSLPSASDSGMHYNIAITVALLSVSILFSTSKVCCLTTNSALADTLIILPSPYHTYFSSSNI
jgi:hypothetical protein